MLLWNGPGQSPALPRESERQLSGPCLWWQHGLVGRVEFVMTSGFSVPTLWPHRAGSEGLISGQKHSVMLEYRGRACSQSWPVSYFSTKPIFFQLHRWFLKFQVLCGSHWNFQHFKFRNHVLSCNKRMKIMSSQLKCLSHLHFLPVFKCMCCRVHPYHAVD